MNFYLPDFYYKYKLNMKIIQLLKECPEYFQDNTQIGAVYGTFPNAIWNGGRCCLLGQALLPNIEGTINAYNKLGIPVRFTFTNCLLEEKHLNDTYCNLIMDAANNGQNEIIINSLILEEYLREKYPNFKYISSTTKCERDVNKINLDCKQYDMVVIDYRDNHNFDFLNQIEDKSKIELLLNAHCHPNCPVRAEHYEILSLSQLNFFETDQSDLHCPGTDNFYKALEFSTVIKNNELQLYNDMGINNYKIEGRLSENIYVIESYLYYFIKPEYQNEVRIILLRT